MIKSASEIETLARTVEDNGGVFFVPAFAGLLAPHWRGDARGLLCGLTAYNTKAHVARAVLESTAFQVLFHYLFRDGVSFPCCCLFRVWIVGSSFVRLVGAVVFSVVVVISLWCCCFV